MDEEYGAEYPQPGVYSPESSGHSGNTQLSSYPPVADGYGRVSYPDSEQRRGHDASKRQAGSVLGSIPEPREWQHGHKSSQRRGESTRVNISGSTDSRQRRNATTGHREEKGVTPTKHKGSKSKHRRSRREVDVDSDASPHLKHSSSRHSSSRPAPMLLGVGEMSGEGGHRSHHRSKDAQPIPTLPVVPQAPKITRLLTPDFDEEEEDGGDGSHCRHNIAKYQFCACCTNGDGFKKDPRREENSREKMVRQGKPPPHMSA
ncbi:hypothetical protein GGR52DRAFT_519080 [Hypoxylon sp. FL1284]|nr:hypothetical protein GGR52DRAFT_519080 [Hypoxylon sp. FL1284]